MVNKGKKPFVWLKTQENIPTLIWKIVRPFLIKFRTNKYPPPQPLPRKITKTNDTLYKTPAAFLVAYSVIYIS